MTNAADRKDVRAAEKQAKIDDREEAQVIALLCSTTAGRRWVWNRLSEAHVFHSSFAGDALAMAFAEGQRNQGLRLLDMIMLTCPENFTLMMVESNARGNQRSPSERSSGADAGWNADRSDSELDFYDRDAAD